MGDRREQGSRSTPLGERVRSAIGEARRQGAVSLRGVQRSVVEAADRLKSTQAAEQLGAAVEIRRAIKKAAEAQRRGNFAMAYRLLEPAVREKPDDAKLVFAFWQAALACERAEDAVPAMLGVIRRLASAGKPDRAAELWMELRSANATALVDPSSLVRMAPALQENGLMDRMVEALREAVDPRNSDLSPGLAMRVAEMAGELDASIALRAARQGLASPDLHETKRARFESLVAEFEKAEAAAALEASAKAATSEEATSRAESRPETEATSPVEGTPSHTEPKAAAAPTEPAVESALEELAPGTRFAEIKLTEGMPTGLQEEGVVLHLLGGRRARVEYAKIEALAVAELKGLAAGPVVVVDLVLNWSGRGDGALRVVRLRSDAFDPRMVIEAPADAGEAFRAFLSELLARSNAIPLPDPDSALGVTLRAFDSLEAYQREVLQVEC
jgi:hypothetical protein